MALPDEKLYLVLKMIIIIGVMTVIIVKATKLVRVTPGGILLEGLWPLVGGFILHGWKYFGLCDNQSHVVGELGLVFDVLLSFSIAI